MIRFDKATYLSLLFKFILSERLSISVGGSDILLFSEFIKYSMTLFYNFAQFIILLYTFSGISFVRCKDYMVCLISFSDFSDVSPAFTCASAVCNLLRIL